MGQKAKLKALRTGLNNPGETPEPSINPFSHKCVRMEVITPLLAPHVRFGDLIALQPTRKKYIGSLSLVTILETGRVELGFLIPIKGDLILWRPQEPVGDDILSKDKWRVRAFASGIAYADSEFKTVWEGDSQPLRFLGPRPDLGARTTLRLRPLAR